MSNFKEFQAKNLDQAIEDACKYFQTDRIKLEINILEDAKTGVFGLIGARKARIEAKLAEIPSVSQFEDKAKKNVRNTVKTNRPKAKPKTEKIEEKEEVFKEKAKHEVKESIGITAGKEKKIVNDEPETSKTIETKEIKEKKVEFKVSVESKISVDEKNIKSEKKMVFEDEEGESQSNFLNSINFNEDEVLDDYTLEVLDREAMEKANLLGNMTEAEIRANNIYQERPSRGSRQRPMRKNDRFKERAPRRDSSEGFGRSERLEKNDRQERYDRSDRSDKNRYEKSDRNFRNERYERQDRSDRSERSERAQNNVTKFDLEMSQDDIKQLSAEDRRQFYIQKRKYERENRPPKQIVVSEYESSPLKRVPLEELDQEKLILVSIETIKRLVKDVIGEDAPITAKINDDRVQVSIECEETGLLIGKEGQNLAAIQYIATRIIARQIDAQVRIQVDTGDYHSRQDARIEYLAQSLAEKVKLTGRPQSTRPLSAYQRRLIHMTLQDETEIVTRSCGEGVLKRVVVMRKRYANQDDLEDQMPESSEIETYNDDSLDLETSAENFDLPENIENEIKIEELEVDPENSIKQ